MKILFAVLLLSALAWAQLVNAPRGFPVPNDGGTGTTLNGTATINSAGQAINATTGNTSVPTYIVVGAAGLTGNAVLASNGLLAPCTMDSTISSAAGGYYVINSTTAAHECHAQSAAPASGTWVIGYLSASSTVSGSTALVAVNGYILGSGSAGFPTVATNGSSTAIIGTDCTGVSDSYAGWNSGVTAGADVFLPKGCVLKFGTNLTVPSSVTVHFAQGAQFAPSAGITVAYNGSVVAGNRQQIVNTANGTVTFNGVETVYVGWYGAPQDGASDDAAAVQIALNANPGKRVRMLKTSSAPCISGAGGGCFGTFDGVFNSQVVVPENTDFGGVTAAGWPAGPVQIKCSNALSAACVWMNNNSFNTRLHDLFLYGQQCWNPTDLTTFDVPAAMDGPGPDGLVVSGGFAKLEDLSIYCFERHGIVLIGNNTLGESPAGQPDFFSIKKVVSYANRSWGVYAVGGDSNAGYGDFIQTYGNQMGGVFDNSQLGSTWNAPGSHVDNRNAVSAGGTQAITSCTVTSNVLSCTTTAGNTFPAKTWVTTSGFSDSTFNTTCKVTSTSSANPFTCNYTHANGSASAGTPIVGTASSTSVYAIEKGLGGQFAKQGAFASNDSSSQQVWINPYCESTSNAPMWGSQTLVIGGDGGHGCRTNLASGTSPGVQMDVLAGALNVWANGAKFNWPVDSSQLTMDFQTGATVDTVAEEVRFFNHSGAVEAYLGMCNGPAGSFFISFAVNGTCATGDPFELDQSGASWLTASGAAFPLNLQWNSTGAVNFFSSTSPPFKIASNGQTTSTLATGTPPMVVASQTAVQNLNVSPSFSSDPGTCTVGQLYWNTTSPAEKYCSAANTWTAFGSGGSGTVTSFSAGALSPLFTTSVANATSTPALTFTLSNAAANTVFGNFTGSPAAPTFTAAPTFSAANLTSFPTFNQNTTGTAANLAGCTPSTAGDICYWNGSAWTRLAGNGSGTNWLQETSAGAPSWTTPSGAGPGSGTQYDLSYWTTTTTLGSVGGSTTVTGQVPTFQNGSAPVATSPGFSDAASSPVSSSAYTIQCDSSTAIIDRGHGIRFQSGASAPVIPLSSASGCANLMVSVMGDGAGALTFGRTGSDTFTIFDGVTKTDGATSFSLNDGQYASVNQAAAGIWEVRLNSGNASKLNGTALSGLGTGILKITTGVPTIAASSDVILLWTGSCSSSTFLRGDGACAAGGGGDTITSPNSTLTVGGTSSATTLDLAGAAGKIMAGATPALTYTPTLGVSGSAGTLAMFPASGNFQTTLGSAATANNTFLFPAAVFTTLHSGYCVTASTTCTWTDTGYPYNAIPTADLAATGTFVFNNAANTGTSAMTIDLSAATSAAAFRLPNIAGASSTTAGVSSYDTTNKNIHAGANGVDNIYGIVPSSITPANNDCVKWTVVSGVVTLNTQGAACGSGGAVSSVNTLTGAVVIEAATAGQMAVSGGSGAALTGAADMTYSTHTFATTTAGIFDWSAATGTNSLKFPAVVGGTFLGGTSTAALSAPIVIQNTNSSNNNTSITMGITAPGTSTGQTVLNVNGAATGGDLADFGTGGTWTNGVLSGQTVVDSFGVTGLSKFGAGPALTAGTGGGLGYGCGTAPTGVASNDAQYCDAANQPHVLSGTTDLGIVSTQSQTAQITGADWSCGTGGTVSSCVAAQTIGTLTFTLPLETKNWSLDCNLVVGQATGVTANNWNLQTATNGATNTEADYSQETAATAIASGVTTGQASTTTTFNIGGTWTQGATGTKMPVHIHATIEGASASGTVLNLQLVAPTVADLVTIYRGSSCRLY